MNLPQASMSQPQASMNLPQASMNLPQASMSQPQARMSKPRDAGLPRAARRGGLPLVALCAALVLAGCVSSAGIVPQAQPISPAGAGIPAQSPGVAVADAWWRAFGESDLDALVDGELDLQRQRYTENGLIPPPIAGSVGNTGLFQLTGSWEIDFFGKNAAALGAALGAQRAAQADAQAARVLLAANVARGYFQLGRLLEQREVAERALAQREETLALIRQRVEAGLDTNVELRQGEAAVPETARQIELIDEQVALARHALAALAAQPPDAFDALRPRLRSVHAVPLPAAIPADLLGRRADVEAARQRVEAATSDVAYAKALLYPNVNLIAFAGLSSLGVNRLINAGSEQYGAGVAIHLPILDAGRLRANVRGKTADLDAAVDSYNAALIDAVRDAADQIASVQSVARQRAKQAEAQARSEQAYDLALQRFRAGLGTYLTVLSAEVEVLAQRRLGVELKARELDSQVALARALGGGYDRAAQDQFSNRAVAAR